jgi:hypothetical protein
MAPDHGWPRASRNAPFPSRPWLRFLLGSVGLALGDLVCLARFRNRRLCERQLSRRLRPRNKGAIRSPGTLVDNMLEIKDFMVPTVPAIRGWPGSGLTLIFSSVT